MKLVLLVVGLFLVALPARAGVVEVEHRTRATPVLHAPRGADTPRR